VTEIEIRVNGTPRPASVAPRLTLADFLREHCQLTGTHLGCEHGVCGACTVLVEIRWCLSGNLCRCTGYQGILEAVRQAAGVTGAGQG
jgi:aerobic-type carbon monoxide dehydrogenase small subunit (CoxS/CutS family)